MWDWKLAVRAMASITRCAIVLPRNDSDTHAVIEVEIYQDTYIYSFGADVKHIWSGGPWIRVEKKDRRDLRDIRPPHGESRKPQGFCTLRNGHIPKIVVEFVQGESDPLNIVRSQYGNTNSVGEHKTIGPNDRPVLKVQLR
jgi:hypothetical protein